MKKFLFSLVVMAFAVNTMTAQSAVPAPQGQEPVKKECCKDHKDGKKCDKPADQQCPDCKEKAEAPKHECKKGEGHECDKAGAPKHECKKGEGHECDKASAPKHECKKGEGHDCDKAGAPKHECKKGEGPKHECKKGEGPKHECKEGVGHKCDKPADQQCPDCKEKAKKN